MKFQKKHTLKEIASIINCNFIGPEDFPVLGMNEIHVVEKGDIVLSSLKSGTKTFFTPLLITFFAA